MLCMFQLHTKNPPSRLTSRRVWIYEDVESIDSTEELYIFFRDSFFPKIRGNTAVIKLLLL